ncbi:MAG: type II toxin-antitoxin system RelE/ParE family toxin [Ignavibacteriaceae bacterium]|nr:type II toxin-antitoxin system RelE/ParE family toxin [Ignavibacterium sp.]MCC6254596.1 type II toxin-antitoxin system RelE/ParE family toxin [Ignavibacteriaceae bacterium]HMN23101.1 type II toxin-antitoxin system RelE/ParE family toxin [Ignavibacteriaceae bacterium]HRN27639.1 type II toxin-antitoxin system RelE/ParE family toxin [Ignavibacteriaceae bacterium]HRP92721.1 type II toxin-antitoxin system RelE/ParE family toxin [Ignavibacteriaceae bacterium]
MVKYKIEFKKSASKELNSLPNKEIKRILNSIDQLSEEPRGVNSKKLSASKYYRIRVGDYRILYEVKDQILIIYIIKIAHRKDIYRA